MKMLMEIEARSRTEISTFGENWEVERNHKKSNFESKSCGRGNINPVWEN